LTDDEIARLPSFKKLRELSLPLPNDAAVTTLAALPHLSKLNIKRNSKVTDACLKPLEGAEILNELEIEHTVPISRAAAAAFAAARPDVIVTWQGEELDSPRQP
jgi:hypothetical protein